MNMIAANPFNPISKEYDQWFDDNRNTFLSESAAVKYFMPLDGQGVEIGVGTGRFALELGIKYGIDPSKSMSAYAQKRGIEVAIGNGENLPYANQKFDYAIMVAVDPFVDDIDKVYSEIYRILKKNGKLIVGMLHKDGNVAKKYMSMEGNEIYRNAQFHSIDESIKQLKCAGFKSFDTCQTLFTPEPVSIEKPIPGYDRGSFVAIEAIKSIKL